MRALRASWLGWVGLCFALGCEDYTRPSEPVWNKQPCDHCHMLISDPRFAAQLVTRSHQRHFFDDPGCLAEYMQERAEEIEHAWVHSEVGWQDVRHARFRTGASSPMGYGFVASGSGDLDFAAVRSAARERRAGGAL